MSGTALPEGRKAFQPKIHGVVGGDDGRLLRRCGEPACLNPPRPTHSQVLFLHLLSPPVSCERKVCVCVCLIDVCRHG